MPNIEHFKNHEEYLQWYRGYREKNRKKTRAYNLLYNRKRTQTKKLRKQNSVKSQLQYAIKVGKIKRLNCEVCKKNNAQGHHNNYDIPLDVIWLCSKHHKWVHINFTLEELKKINKKKVICFLKKLDKVKN